MSIRNLELRARTVVEGSGTAASLPYHGFRLNSPNTGLTRRATIRAYLDWKLAGRTDRYFHQEIRDETNLRCYLLVD